MLDAFMNLLPTRAIAFTILLVGCGIVVYEAVRTSRETLWGDIFLEDIDD